MIDREALLRLCRHYGIVPDYYDIWGTRHELTEQGMLALLSAMGIRVDTDQAVVAAIEAARSGDWRAALPATVVLREGAAQWVIRLHLGAAQDALPVVWRLTEESGTSHEGVIEPDSLPSPGSAEIEGERYVARDFALPVAVPCGYHSLAIGPTGRTQGEAVLVVAPARCYRPAALENGARLWGAAVQLYSVRSERNWGIGDFTDLASLVAQWKARGAAIVGVNPLHALFPQNPEHASPYSPSSRCFLNVLYLDPEGIADFHESREAGRLMRSPAFQARLDALRQSELVDYPGVAAAKFSVLELCYANFRSLHLAADAPRARAFRSFQAAGGPALRLHALFEALQEHFHRQDPAAWGWPAWPEQYRHPSSPEVARFAESALERVEFYEYLQWQANRQLEWVGRQCLQLGMGLGLYQDLAVSVDRGGAEAWASQGLYAVTASIGAPPDDFSLRGQDWGLPPLVPERLRAAGYAPFIAMLRSNMHHAGALRIDHVMGLARLFWVPPGGEPRDGAYVHYPFEDLLGIVALESQRNRCMVIGEALGTVPDEVRAALYREGIFSYRVLYFERQHSRDFKSPGEYPADALVTVSTHDLPTLAGYWEGRDLMLRQAMGIYATDEARQAQAQERAHDRARLLHALEREHLLPEGVSTDPASMPEISGASMRAVHAYLARGPAQVLVVQLEDVLGLREQANLPGTTVEHPNWRRRLPLALERWPADERFIEMARSIERERPQAPPADPSEARPALP